MFIKKHKVGIRTLMLYNGVLRIAAKEISKIQLNEGKNRGNEYFNLSIAPSDDYPEIHCSHGVLDNSGGFSKIKRVDDVYSALVSYVWELYYADLITVEERVTVSNELFSKYTMV